jgi:acyl-CoA thioesterase
VSNDDEQAIAERVVKTMFEADAFSRWLGIEVVDVRPRGSTLRLVVREDMLNGFGACHGGVTFALADSALAFASNTHGKVTVAIENTITYPKRVTAGDVLVAAADEDSATNRLGFYGVTVTRNGEPVAHFRGTVYKTNQAIFPDSE